MKSRQCLTCAAGAETDLFFRAAASGFGFLAALIESIAAAYPQSFPLFFLPPSVSSRVYLAARSQTLQAWRFRACRPPFPGKRVVNLCAFRNLGNSPSGRLGPAFSTSCVGRLSELSPKLFHVKPRPWEVFVAVDGVVHKVRAGWRCSGGPREPDFQSRHFRATYLRVPAYGCWSTCWICHRGLVFQLNDGRYSRRITANAMVKIVRFRVRKLS